MTFGGEVGEGVGGKLSGSVETCLVLLRDEEGDDSHHYLTLATSDEVEYRLTQTVE